MSAEGEEAEVARLARIRPLLEKRARLMRSLRGTFDGEGFLEVETGAVVVEPGQEPTLDPFVVRVPDAPDAPARYLSSSPELRMKRLLAAGYPRIYELSHCFRSGLGETSSLHHPEFTMLEWYRANAGERGVLADVERLLRNAGTALGVEMVERDGARVRLDAGLERLTVRQAFARFARVDLDPYLDGDGDAFRAAAAKSGIAPRPTDAEIDSLFFRILLERVEPRLGRDRPMVLSAWPAPHAALARLDPEDPRVAQRFEIYVAGVELANGFVELTDPLEQRRRFEAERARKTATGRDPGPFPERFLRALEHGMPPAAGVALGVDRLLLLLTGAPRLADLIAFPEI